MIILMIFKGLLFIVLISKLINFPSNIRSPFLLDKIYGLF